MAEPKTAGQGTAPQLGEGAQRLGKGQIGPGGLTKAAGRGARQVRDHLPAGKKPASTAARAKDAVVDEAKDIGQQGPKGEEPEPGRDDGPRPS
ncbi:hypothetical protein [Streptomyces sp. YS415]|uniref:hypothetical protein n=1 Tax=Streptomyces sp. YS415 TaxID=2944806 RepID=UPI00201FD4AD|nr:hypothetical protein [Streptomyces sp. YS415]MCL7429338.1 hypothetical protein [Streptomyces sp. YS415]